MGTPDEIRKRLLGNAEDGYKKFSDVITVPGDHPIVGIRMPVIKQFAKDICKGDWASYLNETDDEYHEDLLLRGFIISYARTDLDERFRMIRSFVPKMDNWAVCDSFSMSFKISKRDADAFWNFVIPFLDTGEEFQIRFAVVMMLAHFVDEEHINDVIGYMDSIKHPAYYVKMGVAWCIADCFIKFPEITMSYLKDNALDDFTFNKALSKITDSFRVSDDAKNDIRRMRRK
ncbi:MAG: DNA alkylation repair protein [Methanomassiliicoccaceae archaeon]|jgi:3-methyladenine DNA glycosylase AlkD|nr:DNA alkylation repair protein [Methanomassiliicoccaceae archaeon]